MNNQQWFEIMASWTSISCLLNDAKKVVQPDSISSWAAP